MNAQSYLRLCFSVALVGAKRIAQTHGGDLTVESAPGKGARFILTLPVDASG
jgi:signal transduction histidine kinase